ncbi:MAG: Holliday junction resolvase RuvX [Anaerolineae bacterium]
MNKKKIVGIDFGTVRIGMALSDDLKLIARPLAPILAQKSLEKTAELLGRELNTYGPLEVIVVGLPLFLSGKDSPLSLQVRTLAASLEKSLSIPVILWDERLTTLQVERALKEQEMSRKQRAGIVDSKAAAAILQNYLDSAAFRH